METLLVRVALLAAVLALGVGAGGATAAGDPAGTITAENELEARIVFGLNAARRARGLRPLRLSAALSAAADAHSKSMARNGFFAHASLDGRSVMARLRPYYGGGAHWAVGENLLWSSPSLEASEALRLWMVSPGHRRNMLAATWRDVGLSAVSVPAAPGVFEGLDVVLVTMTFGARR